MLMLYEQQHFAGDVLDLFARRASQQIVNTVFVHGVVPPNWLSRGSSFTLV